MPTANYNAGLDSSNVSLSYVEESTFATIPTTPSYNNLRILKEGFKSHKDRIRPPEINPYGYAQHAITTKVIADGSIEFGLSFFSYDDFLTSSIGADKFPAVQAASTTGTISFTTTAPAGGQFTITASSGTVFTTAGFVAGQWVRTLGFTNAVNNGFWRVASVTATVLTLSAEGLTTIVETAAAVAWNGTAPTGPTTGSSGAAATAGTVHTNGAAVIGCMVRNSTVVRTFGLEKNLTPSNNLYLEYAGAFVSQLDINAQVGGYVTGTTSFIAKSETTATVTAASVLNAAPTGRIMDTVAGFTNLTLDDSPLLSSLPVYLQSIKLSITKKNARQQFAIGSAAAIGMGRGTIEVSGTLSMYFTSFGAYNLYLNETDKQLAFVVKDSTGNAYVFTLPAVTLMDPQIVAGGPDQDVIAQFTLEGNPAQSTNTNGYYNSGQGTMIQIDRLPIF